MINYSWEVLHMECYEKLNNLDKVVIKIISRYTGVSGSCHKVLSNITTLSAPVPSSFIPYNSLTKNTVVGWIEADLGTQKIQAMQNSIKEKIEADLASTSTVSLPIPWKVETPIIGG
jgi:hypothetical protein